MLTNTLIMSFSSSLDAIGIGVTYGLKRIKFSYKSQIMFFIVALFSTFLSTVLGNLLKNIISPIVANYIGSILIICIGIYTIYETKFKQKDYDFDKSNDIDTKEAIVLSLSVTADSLCIGIGSSLIGININLFPILVATFHLCFLLLGNFLGKRIIKISKIPNYFWGIFSGILLIIIGLFRIFWI